MAIRHLARRRVLQFLYALEFSEQPYANAEKEFLAESAKRRKNWDEFAHGLADRAYAERESFDARIGALLQGWTIDRIPITDKLAMRMALAELERFPDIPVRVTINEYVELVKEFGAEDSPKYVNAVLDKLAKDYAHKDFQRGEAAKLSNDSPPE